MTTFYHQKRQPLVLLLTIVVVGILLENQVGHSAMTISDEQVEQLRSEVPAADASLSTDESLRRYLQASNGKLTLATTKLQRTSDWRSLNNVDELVSWTPSKLVNESLPYAITGYSKEGNPVIYYPLGLWKFRKIRREGKAAEVTMYVNQLLEKALRSTETVVNPRTGGPVNQTIFILDLEGFSPTRSLLTDFGSALFTHARLRLLHDDHYPLLTKWYVIRAPKSVLAFWTVYRNLMSRQFRKNIHVYSRRPQRRWRKALFDTIPRESIPVNLGGTATLHFLNANR